MKTGEVWSTEQVTALRVVGFVKEDQTSVCQPRYITVTADALALRSQQMAWLQEFRTLDNVSVRYLGRKNVFHPLLLAMETVVSSPKHTLHLSLVAAQFVQAPHNQQLQLIRK